MRIISSVAKKFAKRYKMSSSIEDDFVVLLLLKENKKEILGPWWVHPILKYREDGEFCPQDYEVNELDNRHSGFWRLLVRWLWTVKTPQNACYGCKKRQKSNSIQIYLWRTKILEAVCKRDWQNLRSYLFFNVQTFRTKMSDSVCNVQKCALWFYLAWQLNHKMIVMLFSSIALFFSFSSFTRLMLCQTSITFFSGLDLGPT